MSSAALITPYGGALKPLLVDAARAEALKEESRDWPSWNLTARQVCDLELLLNGAFSPLAGYMSRIDYLAVRLGMRLANGTLWPMPVVLDVSESFAKALEANPQPRGGARIALRDPEGVILAVLTIGELWRPDRKLEAKELFGTADTRHPGVRSLLEETNPVYLSGKVEGLELPQYHDFRPLRLTPTELRRRMTQLGWGNVMAFPTHHAMHRPQFEITHCAAREHGAHVLIHPTVGMAEHGDADHFCRVRCLQALLPRYPDGLAMLALSPMAGRLDGPREALLQAIVSRNYGCSHLLVGADHAVARPSAGETPWHPGHVTTELLRQHAAELGLTVVASDRMVYVPAHHEFQPANAVPAGKPTLDLTSADVRRLLRRGSELPEWFTFPEVMAELRKTYPPRSRQGFTVFFTGLSGAGKSTIARALLDKLLEIGGRPVTMLDGDIVRKNLSSELGFSREHRDLNIRRIGFVANQITRNGGIAICAPIAPYDGIRREVRELIAGQGGFVLVYAATPLEVCEQRDRKGLYAKARAGLLKEFTGISDPYEVPADADVVLNTADVGVEEACEIILQHLRKEGYLPEEAAL